MLCCCSLVIDQHLTQFCSGTSSSLQMTACSAIQPEQAVYLEAQLEIICHTAQLCQNREQFMIKFAELGLSLLKASLMLHVICMKSKFVHLVRILSSTSSLSARSELSQSSPCTQCEQYKSSQQAGQGGLQAMYQSA